MRRTPLKPGRRHNRPGTQEQKLRFKRETLRAAGYQCQVLDDGYHEGDVQAHHVITQEAIRLWARSRRVDRLILADVLWDPSNGLAACRRHHDRHTLAIRRLPASLITADARRFAAALDLEYLLDRYYRTEED